MQGILIVDKPMDWTSFDVVAKLRGVLGTRKLGHSGTLDPMATGVLPVFCGGASKAVDLQLDHDKAYRAVLRLGQRTDTGDITGTVLETAPVTAGERELRAVLPQFVGKQMQVPPMYSADIADALGQKGTMSALRRTCAGLYTEADAHTLEEILAAKEQGPAALEALMLPVESVFTPLPLLVVEPWVEQHLYNGCPTSRYPAADGRYRVRNAAGQFLGLANITGGVLRVEKLFVERN